MLHHRPFIWRIWDGHKSGFSALVNYHQLTQANLEKLTYAYLGSCALSGSCSGWRLLNLPLTGGQLNGDVSSSIGID